MTEQSKALRLSDVLLNQVETNGDWSQEQVVVAAAELRRLSAENAVLHERHRGDNVEYMRVLAQRDALLEALRDLVEAVEDPEASSLMRLNAARAAIKAVEEGK